ncbi:hypothetical protein [Streptomyces boluensis]|uniref:Uncharacterized protein n=1 Tax=Streptomyces boluensis TaxID=1775135 RepID=A0A964UIR9_9ACTN|nr:hypothetical protein [Streptomyces boluensis]NBE49908.1 hypothetical protein [Streptomyces boluensis]
MSEPMEQLEGWLDERATAFGEWVGETGAPGAWDFSPPSLDTLEELVRKRFAGEEQILAERGSAFIQGAVWYAGETVRRARAGVMWGFDPWEPGTDELPELFASELGVVTDSPYLVRSGQGSDKGRYPLGAVISLVCTTDEGDHPVRTHLRDLLDD